MLEAMMQGYAARGAADWRAKNPGLRQTAISCLSRERIATTPDAARHAVRRTVQAANPSGPQFIPMPFTHNIGIEHCLFVPRWDGRNVVAFELLAVMGTKKCLGLRFECAGQAGSAHCYPHVQFSTVLLKKDRTGAAVAPTGVPDFLPLRYPAIPLPGYDQFHLFVSMTLAIHGHPTLRNPWPSKFWAGEPAIGQRIATAIRKIRIGQFP